LLGVFLTSLFPAARISHARSKSAALSFVSPDRRSKKCLETVELGSQFFFVKPQFACQSLWGSRPPIRMSAQVRIDANKC